MREFAGKAAFVTGGASGIELALGRPFAEAFVLADVEKTAVASFSSSGQEIRGIICDVADPASVDAAAEETFSAFSNLPSLIPNGDPKAPPQIGRGAVSAARDGIQILIGLARTSAFIGGLATFLVAVPLTAATDNLTIERLATCQDSWLDWKQNNSGRLNKFANELRSGFSHKENDSFFVPNSNQTVVGLPIARVFPESVGMGVGFSVWVNANFNQTKIALERKTGKLLKQCEVGDNMRTCSLELGEKKTVVLMAEDDPKGTTTLIGCYYFYEK